MKTALSIMNEYNRAQIGTYFLVTLCEPCYLTGQSRSFANHIKTIVSPSALDELKALLRNHGIEHAGWDKYANEYKESYKSSFAVIVGCEGTTFTKSS